MTVDYLTKYLTAESFDFLSLLNDDFFQPIRLLFNHGHYISAAKLLMTFIDSIGFVEFGDTNDNPFRKWLETYAELKELAVTDEELWEHRNSLLHMSNLDSRRVLAGKVKRLTFYIGDNLPLEFSQEEQDTKYCNLFSLIQCLAAACGRWCESYNQDQAKIEQCLARYDLIVSDNRVMRVELPKETRN